MSTSTAYLLATGLSVSSILQAILGPQIVFSLIKSGMTWQAGVCGLLYRKVWLNLDWCQPLAVCCHIYIFELCTDIDHLKNKVISCGEILKLHYISAQLIEFFFKFLNKKFEKVKKYRLVARLSL